MVRTVRSLLSVVPRPMRRVGLVYAATGLALWPVPLLNVLHAESAAVVAFVAFFTAGWASLALLEEGRGVREVLLWQEGALLVPALLLTLTLPVVPNCGYGQGALFYLLFPVVSVVLAAAGAYALSAAPWRRKRTLFVAAGMAVAVLTPLYDLGLHPQFYVYNHVFGGVLGPIYDEELVIGTGLMAFRGLTLLWAGLLLVIGRRLRRPEPEARYLGAAVGLVVLIGAVYMGAPALGINTTPRRLQQALGGHLRTTHFDLYYDPATLSDAEVRVLADDHEFRYAQLAERLGVEVEGRIASYLYPDAEAKGRLTGARTTNVAPVWLRRPQVHVLREAYSRVFPHELAHVFSRTFGLPVLRASRSVGLVEGLAVALEPADGLPTPHEQVSVALTTRLDAAGGSDLAGDLAARLSPWGFWTGRGAVSYTTMGSFVRYLLDVYGPGPFKRAYAWADFEGAYGKPVEVLAREWLAYVERLPAVDRAAGPLTRRRFAVPSLFERRCPHYVPRFVRRYREGLAALAAGDTLRAEERWAAALRAQPAFTPALAAWGRLRLAAGAPGEVAARLDTLAAERLTPALAVVLGDALAVTGRPEAARTHYAHALQRLPLYAHEDAAWVALRWAMAAEPGLVRLLTSAAPPDEQARRLDAWPGASPAARVMAALRWAEADAYETALDRLLATPLPDDPAWTAARRQGLQRQRLAWLARLAYRAGRLAEAAAYARQAAGAYRAAGDRNSAGRWLDFAAKMRHVYRFEHDMASGADS